MYKKKSLQELTIKDNFMFGAVMSDENNCRRLLELILGFPIERVEISQEKSIFYHPEYKGVRLDVFAKDELNTRYNVEMQAASEDALGKRSRYYHSQIDMEMLASGVDYSELSDAYVIFICNFDPFGQKKYLYTFKSQCIECIDTELDDGRTTIFLSTSGNNEAEVPQELVKFLKFVKADINECMSDFGDDFVETLQKSMAYIKENRDMEERFMRLELLLRDERKEAKAEGRAEGKAEYLLTLLESMGEIPQELGEKILAEKDSAVLDHWFQVAMKATSIEEFATSI